MAPKQHKPGDLIGYDPTGADLQVVLIVALGPTHMWHPPDTWGTPATILLPDGSIVNTWLSHLTPLELASEREQAEEQASEGEGEKGGES